MRFLVSLYFVMKIGAMIGWVIGWIIGWTLGRYRRRPPR